MRGMFACAAWCALVAACGVSHPGGSTDQPSGGPLNGGDDGTSASGLPSGGGSGSGSGSGSGASCPNGAPTYTTALGLSDERQVLDLAVDKAGNAVFAAGPSIFTNPSELTGVVGLSPSGDVRFTLPFGSVVAMDDAGNAYVAGSFIEPIDLGFGVMTPVGIDVFVAKVDAKGRVVFAKALDLCGDGVQSIAVAPDGRIAVSGAAMGTVILSPAGDIELQLTSFGDLAFDSKRNLVIYGQADGGLFVTEVDPGGRELFNHFMAAKAPSTATSVAIGPNDEVVFVGFTTGSIDLFGTTIMAMGAGENGRVTGAFAVKLDAKGAPVFVLDLGIVEANGVAVDANGRLVINGALTGGTGFNRRLVIDTYDDAGNRLKHIEEFVASGDGRGYAVGVDACGSIYAALVALDTPSRISPLRSYVVKLEL